LERSQKTSHGGGECCCYARATSVWLKGYEHDLMLGGLTLNLLTKGEARRRVEEIVRRRLKVVASKKFVVVVDADTLCRNVYGSIGEVVDV
jgi:hypothetical protein